MQRSVSAHLEADLTGGGRVELQVAVARTPGTDLDEELVVRVDDRIVEPGEVETDDGTRVHVLSEVVGRLSVVPAATVTGRGEPAAVTGARIVYARASRYADSDRLFGFARKQFGTQHDHAALLQEVTSWVSDRLDYVQGSSTVTDGAADTLLGRAGSAATTRTWWSRCAVRSGCRPGTSPCTRRGCRRWTPTPWSRWRSTGCGGCSTPPGWHRGPRWCASAPDATPPTRRS